MAAPQFNHFNTEEDFVFASVREFVKTWASGKRSKLELECKNGRLWLQFGFQLNQPNSLHSFPRRQKSEKQRNRDWLRAEQYRAAHKKSSRKSPS